MIDFFGKKATVVLVVLITAGIGIYFLIIQQQPTGFPGRVAFTSAQGDVVLRVAVADTDAERVRGLSGREKLAPLTGMLFVFDQDGVWGIWMKDMNFPIDVLWLDEQGRVVDSVEQIAPEHYPDVYSPETPARYVLEVPAGFITKYNIQIGQYFTIEK